MPDFKKSDSPAVIICDAARSVGSLSPEGPYGRGSRSEPASRGSIIPKPGIMPRARQSARSAPPNVIGNAVHVHAEAAG
jgi:hypothetical protein